MPKHHRREHTEQGAGDPSRFAGLAGASAFSLAIAGLVLVTARATETPLGAPASWPWLLTALQVVALWAAGGERWWGWLLGASVQPPWIAYALETGQLGFIPGCLISSAVQVYSFLRGSSRAWPGANDALDRRACA